MVERSTRDDAVQRWRTERRAGVTGRMILAGVALCASTALSAQNDGRDYGRPLESPENRADMALRFEARCVYTKVPSSARKLLASEIGSKDEGKIVKGLLGVARICFPSQNTPPATPFRDAVAEVAYRDAYRTEPKRSESAPPASFGVVAAGTSGSPEQESAWQLAAIANCGVFASPHEAHQWISGPRNVPEEEKRFDAFKPAIARCVAPTVAAQLTARIFRGPVAQALLTRADKK